MGQRQSKPSEPSALETNALYVKLLSDFQEKVDFWGENLSVEDLPLFMDESDGILAMCVNGVESKEISVELLVEMMIKLAAHFCDALATQISKDDVVGGVAKLRQSQNKIASALMLTAGTAVSIVKSDFTFPESTLSKSFPSEESWEVRRLVLEPIATSGVIGDRLWEQMEKMDDFDQMSLLWTQISFFADNPKVVTAISKKFAENAKTKYSAIAAELAEKRTFEEFIHEMDALMEKERSQLAKFPNQDMGNACLAVIDMIIVEQVGKFDDFWALMSGLVWKWLVDGEPLPPEKERYFSILNCGMGRPGDDGTMVDALGLWTLNQGDKDEEVILSEGDMVALFNQPSRRNSSTSAVRGTIPFTSGKHFWEFEILSSVGSDSSVGVCTSEQELCNETRYCPLLGENTFSWSFHSARGPLHDNTVVPYPHQRFNQNDKIGVNLDMVAGTLEFIYNSVPGGVAFEGLTGLALFPVISSTMRGARMKLSAYSCDVRSATVGDGISGGEWADTKIHTILQENLKGHFRAVRQSALDAGQNPLFAVISAIKVPLGRLGVKNPSIRIIQSLCSFELRKHINDTEILKPEELATAISVLLDNTATDSVDDFNLEDILSIFKYLNESNAAQFLAEVGAQSAQRLLKCRWRSLDEEQRLLSAVSRYDSISALDSATGILKDIISSQTLALPTEQHLPFHFSVSVLRKRSALSKIELSLAGHSIKCLPDTFQSALLDFETRFIASKTTGPVAPLAWQLGVGSASVEWTSEGVPAVTLICTPIQMSILLALNKSGAVTYDELLQLGIPESELQRALLSLTAPLHPVLSTLLSQSADTLVFRGSDVFTPTSVDNTSRPSGTVTLRSTVVKLPQIAPVDPVPAKLTIAAAILRATKSLPEITLSDLFNAVQSSCRTKFVPSEKEINDEVQNLVQHGYLSWKSSAKLAYVHSNATAITPSVDNSVSLVVTEIPLASGLSRQHSAPGAVGITRLYSSVYDVKSKVKRASDMFKIEDTTTMEGSLVDLIKLFASRHADPPLDFNQWAVLLQTFNWDSSLLQLEIEHAGIASVLAKHSIIVSVTTPIEAETVGTCSICCDDLTEETRFSLRCGHTCCRGCWSGYLAVEMRDLAFKPLQTSCFQKCGLFVPDSVFCDLLGTEALKTEYKQKVRASLLTSYLKSAQDAVMCRCGRTLTCVDIASGVSITCDCGFCFCAGCRRRGMEGDFNDGEPHGPVPCDSMTKWLSLTKAGGPERWRLLRIKPCPKCQQETNKCGCSGSESCSSVDVCPNAACDHITCPCGHQWCWVCSKPWANHNAEVSHKVPTDEKEKFLACSNLFLRFAGKQKAMDRKACQLSNIGNQTLELRISPNRVVTADSGASLCAAARSVQDACRVLKWAYVELYFQRDTAEMALLEDQTQQLHSLVEKVVEMIDKNGEDATVENILRLSRAVTSLSRQLACWKPFGVPDVATVKLEQKRALRQKRRENIDRGLDAEGNPTQVPEWLDWMGEDETLFGGLDL